MLILGIESSCDETAAAVVRDGREILSSVIASQIEMHKPFGGVVPELASREHLAVIGKVVKNALEKAGVEPTDIDAVAVTQGPGLIGSLLIGVNYAKSFAYAIGKPMIGVNHIEGHVYSVNFENPPVVYPAVALIVSGGHTNLFLVPKEGEYKIVSRTRDDAAGEAFDKVAKMLGLGYPGGPVIEKLAAQGDPLKVRFTRPKISDGKPDLSFSGLKTAVARYLKENDVLPGEEKHQKDVADLAASFQHAVVRSLVDTIREQAPKYGIKTLIVAGGVACNLALREASEKVAAELGIPAYFPSKHLSTDNAAMIAAAGHFHLMRNEASDLSMTADVTLRLQGKDNDAVGLKGKKVRYRL